jgi:hypothetical protein
MDGVGITMTTTRTIDIQDVRDLVDLIKQYSPEKALLQKVAWQFMFQPAPLLYAQIVRIAKDNSDPALKFKRMLTAIENECFQHPKFIDFISEVRKQQAVERNLPQLEYQITLIEYPVTLINVVAEVSKKHPFSLDNACIPKGLVLLNDVLEMIIEAKEATVSMRKAR